MPALDATLRQKIDALNASGRLRELRPTTRINGGRVQRGGKEYISFSCNDYLGLGRHPEVLRAAEEALHEHGAGAGASRLITGDNPLYSKLEAALAEYRGADAACVFGSGYLANVGVISALMGRHDVVIADKLVHACILDGVKLSGAKLLRFAHNDAQDCARLLQEHRAQHPNCLVITETVFSMDGDKAPLKPLRALCDEHDAWLMTDDAHGFGMPYDVAADIKMGTLSKALGAYGGYVAGSKTLVQYLKTAARSLIFTTGLPPATLAAAVTALRIMRREPERSLLALMRARQFSKGLGLPVAQSTIVPLLIGSEDDAMDAAARLEEHGFLVTAIRPPTVPDGTSRLRFAFSSEHEEQDITRLIKAIKDESIGA